MWRVLFRSVTSRRCDLAVLEWTSGIGAFVVLVCGFRLIESLWLDAIGLLVGYSLLVLIVIAMVCMALLADLLRRLAALHSPPAD